MTAGLEGMISRGVWSALWTVTMSGTTTQEHPPPPPPPPPLSLTE